MVVIFLACLLCGCKDGTYVAPQYQTDQNNTQMDNYGAQEIPNPIVSICDGQERRPARREVASQRD